MKENKINYKQVESEPVLVQPAETQPAEPAQPVANDQPLQSTAPAAVSSAKLISVGELFKQTWELFKRGFLKLLAIQGIGYGINIGLVILLGIILLVSILIGIIDTSVLQKISPPELGPYMIQSSAIAVWDIAKTLSLYALPLIFGLVIFLSFIIASYFISASSFVLVNGITKNLGIKESMRQARKKLTSFIWVNILEGLIIGIGFMLLFIPGIIFMTWFMFSPYVFICDGIKGKAALSKSKELVKGYWWPIFGRILIMTLIMLSIPAINYLIPIIGFLAGIAFSLFSLVYYYVLYRDLQRVKQA